MIDTTSLGDLVAKIMDRLGRDFGSDAMLRTAALVVEVDSGEMTHILSGCTDDRPWVHMEFLNQGIDSIADQMRRLETGEGEQ